MTEQKKKVKACKDTEYLFISAYLRAKEPQLLNAEKAGRMLGSSVQEAARILESCGYADVLAVGLDKAVFRGGGACAEGRRCIAVSYAL